MTTTPNSPNVVANSVGEKSAETLRKSVDGRLAEMQKTPQNQTAALRLAIKMAEIESRMILSDKAVPNGNSTQDAYIQTLFQEALEAINELSPDAITVKLKEDARTLINLTPVGGANFTGNLADLIIKEPSKEAEIREAAIDAFVKDYLNSTNNRTAWSASLDTNTRIDVVAKDEIRKRVDREIQTRTKEMIDRFNSGEIKSLDDFRTEVNQINNPELKALLTAEVTRMEERRKVFRNAGNGTSLGDVVISNSLVGMTPPLLSIYQGMIDQTERLRAAQERHTAAKAEALKETAKAEATTDLEIFGKRMGSLIKYGGPALMVGLLLAGVGAGGAALLATGDPTLATLIGVTGGSLGILAGVSKYASSGGLKDWRTIGALKTTALETIEKGNADAEAVITKNRYRDWDYINFLIEIATRGEAAKYGRSLTQEDINRIKNEIRISAGAGIQDESFKAAMTAVQNTQLT